MLRSRASSPAPSISADFRRRRNCMPIKYRPGESVTPPSCRMRPLRAARLDANWRRHSSAKCLQDQVRSASRPRGNTSNSLLHWSQRALVPTISQAGSSDADRAPTFRTGVPGRPRGKVILRADIGADHMMQQWKERQFVGAASRAYRLVPFNLHRPALPRHPGRHGHCNPSSSVSQSPRRRPASL